MKDEDNRNELPDKSTTISHQSVKTWTGDVFALLAAIATATGNLLIKISPEDKMLIVMLRSMMQFLILLPVVTKQRTNILGSHWKITLMLVMRGTLGSITMTLFAASLNYLPVGDATAIYYVHPALVMLFACIFLKENCGFFSIFLTVMIITGFTLVAQPSFIFGQLSNQTLTSSSSVRFIGILFVLVGAILHAFVFVLLRKMGIEIHFSQSLLYYSLICTILNVIIQAVTTQKYLMCFSSLPIAVAAGMTLFFAQISTTLALQRVKAGTVTLIQSAEVVFSYFLQFVFLNEIPNFLSFIGAGLILLVCTVLGLKTIWKVVTPQTGRTG